MTIYHTANIVARLELNLVLDVKVDNAHDAIRCEQVGERVDDRMKLGNHGKTVAHGQEVCTDVIGCIAFVECALANTEERVFVIMTLLVVAELEGTSILADDLDVLPAEAGKSGSGNLAQRRGKIDKVDCVEEARDRKVSLHLLDVPASTSTNVLQAKVELAMLGD